jgi:hypothetical protein
MKPSPETQHPFIRRPGVRWMALAVATVLIIASCGDSDGGSDTASVDEDLKPYAEALAQAFDDDDDLSLGASERTCIGNGLASMVGQARLEAAGDPAEVLAATGDDLTALEITESEADRVGELIWGCVPNLLDVMQAEFTADDSGLTEDQTDCLLDVINKDFVVSAIASGALGIDSDDAFGEFEEDLFACFAS